MNDYLAVSESLSLDERKVSIYAHIFYGNDVEKYRQNYAAGLEPDETPYGFHLAAEEGFNVSFSRDAAPGTGLSARLARRLARQLPYMDVLHAFSNRRRIRAADAVWTMTEREAFAVAALMALHIVPRRPLIGNAVWLLNEWHGYGRRRRLVYRFLSRYISLMTVHSKGCLPILREALPCLRSQLLYFGINTRMFELTPPQIEDGQPLRLFAAGNDRSRDWTTLLDAFGNDPRFHLTVACGWLSDTEIERYDNVTALRTPTMSEFRLCYAETDIVVVPMKPNVFSGITVALEAVALGKPVLGSRTGGLSTYFEEGDLLYVPVGDSAAMREAAAASTPESRAAQARRAQARFVERDYSTRAMIGRYATVTRELLALPQ